MKTFEVVLQKDAYLNSVYMELIKIEFLFQSLPNFITQSSYMLEFVFSKIDADELPDDIMDSINAQAATMYKFGENSIEMIFLYRLIADKLEIQKEYLFKGTRAQIAAQEKQWKMPKPLSKFLLQKLYTKFYHSLKNFPIVYEQDSNWYWGRNYEPGGELKWSVSLQQYDSQATVSAYLAHNNVVESHIEKIDWQGDERLLPYLIHLLNKSTFLNEKNMFAFIAKHFTVNGKEIKRENLKANYQQANYLIKKGNQRPSDMVKLDAIKDMLLELDKSLNSTK